MERFKFITEKNFSELPKTSGVYVFFTKNFKFQISNFKLECIYIGKAINIQNRVKNHFSQPSYRDNLYIEKVSKIGYFETNSEIEALILEANLIKKYQPKFNVVWKDGKNYFYVAIAQNENRVPYIFITHQPNLDSRLRGNDKYIGPFVEGVALKKTLRFLRRVFPYYSAKKHPKTKCTYCHLGLCPGPNPDLKEYKKNIKKLILILQGKRNTVLNSLKKEMKQLSKENKFEEAGKIRDRINNLQQVMSHTHVLETRPVIRQGAPSNDGAKLAEIIGLKTVHKIECYDVSNIQGKFATGSMVVFVDGAPDKSQYKKFKIKLNNEPNDIAMLKETITRRLNHPEWGYPDVMLIDGGKAQLNIAIEVKNNLPIKVISIAKGRQELFIKGRSDPIPLKDLPQEVYNLIKHLDDEAHRLAITYHKKLRKNELLK
ncbi:MAG: UvrB/UvrC motif-containing protein [Candidatus Staskawiczbacteria bacterium]|nr:UvrB/UvrC motif-containing protein [Candidatus Staskawiczbacteria bacterium]